LVFKDSFLVFKVRFTTTTPNEYVAQRTGSSQRHSHDLFVS
jgi:hypothetical protein